MDSNTHSASEPVGLAALAAELQRLAAQDRDRLTDTALVEGALRLRQLADGVDGHWLAWLAAVDARGAAGAEEGVVAGSTAGWLRRRLRMSAGAARSCVRTARALYRGPLAGTAKALAAGELSPAHATVLAHSTHDLPTQVAADAEPVLLEAARRLDPPRLRQAIAHLRLAADPDGADARAEHQHERRGLWVSSTWEGMVAVNGLLDPEAGQTLLAALDPLARPSAADDDRSASQRRADALAELARRQLEGGRLPQTGGVRPQLLVTVDLDSLLGPGGPGGEVAGGAVDGVWPLDPAACRRLACDGAVTRVLVTRHQTDPDHDQLHHHDHDPLPDPTDEAALAPGSKRRCGCCPRPLVGHRPSRWSSAAAPGWSARPNAPPWWSATAAARWRAATDPRAGVRPIIWSTGSMAAPPTWTTWPWCAAPIIGRCMRAAGGWAAVPMAASRPSRRIEDPAPRPDPATPTTANRIRTQLPHYRVEELAAQVLERAAVWPRRQLTERTFATSSCVSRWWPSMLAPRPRRPRPARATRTRGGQEG
jgi:Domain of unknown function (DUF222)